MVLSFHCCAIQDIRIICLEYEHIHAGLRMSSGRRHLRGLTRKLFFFFLHRSLNLCCRGHLALETRRIYDCSLHNGSNTLQTSKQILARACFVLAGSLEMPARIDVWRKCSKSLHSSALHSDLLGSSSLCSVDGYARLRSGIYIYIYNIICLYIYGRLSIYILIDREKETQINENGCAGGSGSTLPTTAAPTHGRSFGSYQGLLLTATACGASRSNLITRVVDTMQQHFCI